MSKPRVGIVPVVDLGPAGALVSQSISAFKSSTGIWPAKESASLVYSDVPSPLQGASSCILRVGVNITLSCAGGNTTDPSSSNGPRSKQMCLSRASERTIDE